MLVLGCWVALCGEWHALGSGGETFPGGAVGAAANPQGMLSLLGATGTLALTLLLTAAGTLRRRPLALGAGLVLSSLALLVLVGCLAGYPLLPAVGEGGLYADAAVRVPFFALLSVLVGVVVAADVVAAAAYLANRDATAPTNADDEERGGKSD